jgi:hypothetical protein
MKIASVVVETNVALAADGKASQADHQCELRCLQELMITQKNGKCYWMKEG